MTAPIHIDVAAAQDALARLDDGEGRPGDEALAEQYESYLQAAALDREHARHERERAEWLAGQCGGCESGGTGEACDTHWDEEATP